VATTFAVSIVIAFDIREELFGVAVEKLPLSKRASAFYLVATASFLGLAFAVSLTSGVASSCRGELLDWTTVACLVLAWAVPLTLLRIFWF
jgi:hypothetical protein